MATIYVIDPDPRERRWVESVLAPTGSTIAFVADVAALAAQPALGEDACLIASIETDEPAILDDVRLLRARGVMLPVIVLGPQSAFRAAVAIARLPATDYLERPVSARQLRAAVRRVCHSGA